MMEVGAGVLYAEAPVWCGLEIRCAPFRGLGTARVYGLHVGEASGEATAREKTAELDFSGHIQPAAMPGGVVVKFRSPGRCAGLLPHPRQSAA